MDFGKWRSLPPLQVFLDDDAPNLLLSGAIRPTQV